MASFDAAAQAAFDRKLSTTEAKSLNCVTRAFTTASQAVEGLGMGRDLDTALNATSCECGLRLPEGGLC